MYAFKVSEFHYRILVITKIQCDKMNGCFPALSLKSTYFFFFCSSSVLMLVNNLTICCHDPPSCLIHLFSPTITMTTLSMSYYLGHCDLGKRKHQITKKIIDMHPSFYVTRSFVSVFHISVLVGSFSVSCDGCFVSLFYTGVIVLSESHCHCPFRHITPVYTKSLFPSGLILRPFQCFIKLFMVFVLLICESFLHLLNLLRLSGLLVADFQSFLQRGQRRTMKPPFTATAQIHEMICQKP